MLQEPSTVKVFVNGDPREFSAGATVTDVLRMLDRPPLGIAVEINREVVPRSKHAETCIAEGDRIEIVHMVGGG